MKAQSSNFRYPTLDIKYQLELQTYPLLLASNKTLHGYSYYRPCYFNYCVYHFDLYFFTLNKTKKLRRPKEVMAIPQDHSS
mgnify:CR=1 FL=1